MSKTDKDLTKKKRKAPKSAWKPGQSGNPYGRPKKGCTMTEALQYALEDEVYQKDGSLLTPKELIAKKIIQLALRDGNVSALKYIYDRVEGTPTQKTDFNMSGDITINITNTDKDESESNS